MKLLLGHDDEVIKWVLDRLNAKVDLPNVNMSSTIGFIENGEIAGGVVYTNYSGADIEITAALDTERCANRGNLRAVFSYPFEQLNCLRVTARADKKNKRARAVLEKMGFTHEGTHPRLREGKTVCSYGLLREDCKWLAR